MEQEPKEYRDDLAEKLHEIRNEDKEVSEEGEIKMSDKSRAKAEGYLDAVKDVSKYEYKKAEERTTEDRNRKIKKKKMEAIRAGVLDFINKASVEERVKILFEDEERFKQLAKDFYSIDEHGEYYFNPKDAYNNPDLSKCDKDIRALKGMFESQKTAILEIIKTIDELEKSQDKSIEFQLELSKRIPAGNKLESLFYRYGRDDLKSSYPRILIGLNKLSPKDYGGMGLLDKVNNELGRRRNEEYQKKQKETEEENEQYRLKQNKLKEESELKKFDPEI